MSDDLVTADTDGRPYAKLSELKVGDVLEADGGFTCIKKGAVLPIWVGNSGQLTVSCLLHGGHEIGGQADDGEHLVGFYKVEG